MTVSGWGIGRGRATGSAATHLLSAGCLRSARAGLAALLLLAMVATPPVQAEAVCSNAPTTGQWIACLEDATSTNDIDIDLQGGVNITTSGERDHGIFGSHEGAGDITINVNGTEDNKTITTSGDQARGVYALSQGKGSIDITVTNVDITTTNTTNANNLAYGVSAHQYFGSADLAPYDGTYNVKIRVSDSQINTAGTNSTGIHGYYGRSGSLIDQITDTSNLELTAINTDITTAGDSAYGIHAQGVTTEGDVKITMTGGRIATAGPYARGIRGLQAGLSGNLIIHVTDADIETTYDGSTPAQNNPVNRGIEAWNESAAVESDVTVTLVNTDITTMGPRTNAVLGGRINGNGDIRIDLQGTTIQSNGERFHTGDTFTVAHAVYGYTNTDGDIIIDARAGTDIRTKGAFSYGLRGISAGEGDIRITTHAGSSIMNTGPSGHGIDVRNTSTDVMDDTRSIAITVGGDITASGENAHGVRIGTGSGGFVGLDEDGYRRQTITVNGQVTGGSGTGAGIYLSNGGRVIIGPQGSIGADSGIAILATGTVPEDTTDPNNVIPAIKPKLWVDLNLAGRRVEQALGDNWIINDGGETTIAVNNVVLHDGETGVTGSTARNGAWNVRMREHGAKVDDRADPDPANWMFTESTDADPIIADRDFSAQDFTETRRPVPPPPMCPAGQSGTPPDCMEPEAEPETEPEIPMFMEEYAPRAALYETLPGFLLRMAERGPLSSRLVSSETPIWFSFSGSNGSVDPSRSTTGATYDYDRFMVQLGKNLALGQGLEGRFAAHYLQGDSDVSSPTGGGDIEADGTGVAFDIQWHHASGYYLGGHASLTNYDIDLSSDTIGRLKSSVDALGASFSLETGLRLAMGEDLHLMPRAWLSHSSIDIDSFTDTVNARASFPDEARLTGGMGALAETMRHWNGGELTWHGSLDIEQRLNSRSTSVNVSGEKLKNETVSTRLLLGLGSLYRKGDFSISTQVSVDGLGTNDEEYSGQLNIGVRL